MAAWRLALSLIEGTPISNDGVSWVPLVLLAWHVDDQLAAYYRAQIGSVFPSHRARRLIGLGAIAVAYVALRLFEAQAESPVALSALLLAGVQLHIGLFSGETYRRHYLVGAACWTILSWVPLLAISMGSRGVLWLTAIGVTLVWLGWRDHVLLLRSLTDAKERLDAKDL